MMRIVFWFAALLVTATSGLMILEAASAGLPDGYITPYDRQTGSIVLGLGWLGLLFGTLAGALKLRGKSSRAAWSLAVAGIALSVLLAVNGCPRSTGCSRLYLAVTGLNVDDGQGG